METFKCVKRPAMGEVSPPIDRDNIYDVAYWCFGSVVVPLFADLTGPEIEVMDCVTSLAEFARIGDRIVKYGDHAFHKVTADDFQRDYAIIPTSDKSNHVGYIELPVLDL